MGTTNDVEAGMAVALRAARHIGELMARMHVDDLWGAKRDPDQARWVLQRLSAERRTALAEVMLTLESSWWESATVDDVAHAYRLACTWGRHDSDFARFETWIVAMVGRRYGVRVETRPGRESSRARAVAVAVAVAADVVGGAGAGVAGEQPVLDDRCMRTAA